MKRHQKMVTDPLRTPLISQAIKKVIQKDQVVFEIGAGTGVLTLEALKAGASQIYACEVDESLRLAKEAVRKAGYADKVNFFDGLSSEITLPEKVDVILSETIGSLGFNENILPYVIDARQKHLKKNGSIIPGKLALFLAPTSHQIPVKQTHSQGYFEAAFQIALIPSQTLMASGIRFFEADFHRIKSVGFDQEHTFTLSTNGAIQAMAGWINVEWAPGISTNTSPDQPPTHWQQAYLPLAEPIKVKKGDQFLFRLRIGPNPDDPLEALIEWGYKKLS